MHRCLQTQEIVAVIADFAYTTPRPGLRPITGSETETVFDDDPPRGHDTSTVLSCALTCRAFLEPFLDALWSRQTSLNPLLACFPPALLDGEFKYAFQRAVQPKHWSRVMYYARRIRQLSHQDRSPPLQPLEESMFSFFSIYRPVLCIFSNLRTIVCRSAAMLQYIHIFLGPRLENFTYIKFGKLYTNSLIRLFPSIACVSPSIQSIVIDPGPHEVFSARLDSVFCKIALSLSCLRRFDFPLLSVSEPTLSCLSRLPDLEYLRFWIEFDPGALSISTPRGFRALEQLYIDVDSVEHFTSFMTHVSSDALWFVEIALHILPTESGLREAFQTLKEHRCNGELEQQLSVGKSGHWIENASVDGTISPSPITSDALRPLLGLAICTINIALPCSYDIDDSFIEDLAIAWPSLSEVHLLPSKSFDSESVWTSNVSATAIVHLAIHCRLLTKISILFDATEVPDWDELEELRPDDGYSVALTTLNVGNSPITNPAEVADFLAEMFGRIEVTAWEEEEEEEEEGVETYKRWKDVNHIIPTFFPSHAEGKTGSVVSDDP